MWIYVGYETEVDKLHFKKKRNIIEGPETYGKWSLVQHICEKGIPSLLRLFSDFIEGSDSNKNVATAARSTA